MSQQFAAVIYTCREAVRGVRRRDGPWAGYLFGLTLGTFISPSPPAPLRSVCYSVNWKHVTGKDLRCLLLRLSSHKWLRGLEMEKMRDGIHKPQMKVTREFSRASAIRRLPRTS